MLKRYSALSAALALLLILCACERSPAPPPDTSPSPEPPPSSAVTETDPPPSSVPADAPESPAPIIPAETERFFGGMLSDKEHIGFTIVPAEGFSPSSDLPPFRFVRGDAFAEVGCDPSSTPDELAPSFMNAYIAFTDIEFSSYSGLGRDGLSAETVTASDGSQLFSAYLIEADGGCVWLLFACPADDAEAVRDMDLMRDSFVLVK